MAENLNTFLVKHIANGTLSQICIVCLAQVEEYFYENIFTLICKTDSEYCVADALAAVCQFEFEPHEIYNICTDCFTAATNAYKFQQQAKKSMELITFYTQELLNNVNNVEITDQDTDKLLCIPLTDYTPKIQILDVNLEGIGSIDNIVNNEDENDKLSEEDTDPDDNILVVVETENEVKDEKEIGEKSEESQSSDDDEVYMIINEKKVRKKRNPMEYMKCTRCPVKYRFISKLKEHIKKEHDVDIYYCKNCKIYTEDKTEYKEHLKEHTNEYQCAICNVIYKKKSSLLMHMKQHYKQQMEPEQLENANICEVCGAICSDEASLEEHTRLRHMKRFTCPYCGRHYRAESSFEQHVKKHELKAEAKHGLKPSPSIKQTSKQSKGERSICNTCGKDFVDERSLLWHQRLHNNDRPFTCQVCGRGFVSVNRRNQHALCAHTPPARRCPLCPALFHLRSMVNTHVKKVHLKAHKRRNRSSKHQNVFWKTQAVPVQELSIDVQNDVLELQAAQFEEVMVE